MNKPNHKKDLKTMKEFIKEVTSSKRKSKNFLIKAGIINKDGSLAEPYAKGEEVESNIKINEPPSKLPPLELTWLYSHCRALGMIKHSDSKKIEEDIALFVTDLKQRVTVAEDQLAKLKSELIPKQKLKQKRTKKPKPYHIREMENINKLIGHIRNKTILKIDPPRTVLAATLYSEMFHFLTHKKKKKKQNVDINKIKSLFSELCFTINDKYEGYGGGDRPSSPPSWLMDLALKSDRIKKDFLKVLQNK